MSTTEVVLDGGEVIEDTDALALYTAEYRWADKQARAWLVRKHFAALQCELHQSGLAIDPRVPSGSYGSALAKTTWYVAVDCKELAEMELDREDMIVLIANALGFDFQAIDPGLRGNKPRLWEPTTALGHTLKDMARRVPFYPALVDEP